VAAALGAALFTALFWLSVAVRLGRLTLPRGTDPGAYPAAVVLLYFFGVLVAGPVLAHTGGFLLDRATSTWRRDDAVVAFAGLGALLAAVAVAVVVAAAPGGSAFAPAVWLFGLPAVLALALTRFWIDDVLASRRWTIAALAVGYGPSLIAALVLLGLYVGHATVVA
jgi:hypothetical protein